MRRGDRVLDLGCAPGAWLQVASEIVGPGGLVVGVDLQPVMPGLPANTRAYQGDITVLSPEDMLAWIRTPEEQDATYDVVISDVAPNTTGAGDHYRSERLCRRVLEIAAAVLRPRGNLVMKVFEGELYPALLKDTARIFTEARGFKPKASRDPSREIYILALDLRVAGGSAAP